MDRPYPQPLFSGFSLRQEVNQITHNVTNSLGHATLASLTSKPLDDIVQALYSENEPQLPYLLKDQATHEQFEWFYEPFLKGFDPRTKLQDMRRGVVFSVEMPFKGDGKYFRTRPHPSIPVPLAAINENNTLAIYVPAENYTFPDVQARFDAIIESIEANLQAQHDNLRDWPMEFREAVIRTANIRLSRLRQAESISAGLTFKPKRRENAPDLTVLPVRKQIRPAPFDFRLPLEQQYVLAEETYQHILSVMQNMSLVMEYSPKAFADLGEEALRFHFLVQLNGQYEGKATGETFNGEGKTDIIIKQGGANVFIAECKFWSGPKAFTETIDQLLGYLTWRDTKAAVVIFNRNKDFSDVLKSIEETADAHQHKKSGPIKQGDSRLQYVFGNPADHSREVFLTIMAFNVPVPQKT